MRQRLCKLFFKNAPKGDLWEWKEEKRYKISCIYVFYNNFKSLESSITCLANQSLEKDDFEVVLIEDHGGSEKGGEILKKFDLNIQYFSPKQNWGYMGYMRNFGLSKALGEFVLFLDDDTVILDKEFLKKLIEFFDKDKSIMAVIPKGNPSFCLLESRYGYHDPYFFTNRCAAYRKDCLIEMKGFDNSFIGQEDVEFAIRFLAKGYKYIKTDKLQYYHPPFLANLRKAQAVGYSFANSKYNLMLKLLLVLNGSRWMLRAIYPTFKNKNMAKFGFGFLLGFLKGLFGLKKPLYV